MSDSRHADQRRYALGYAAALALTCAAFALVRWHWFGSATTLAIVLTLGLVQMAVHFGCFLHVTFARSGRDAFWLLLFSTVIVALMVGGTLVVLLNLRDRMM